MQLCSFCAKVPCTSPPQRVPAIRAQFFPLSGYAEHIPRLSTFEPPFSRPQCLNSQQFTLPTPRFYFTSWVLLVCHINFSVGDEWLPFNTFSTAPTRPSTSKGLFTCATAPHSLPFSAANGSLYIVFWRLFQLMVKNKKVVGIEFLKLFHKLLKF